MWDYLAPLTAIVLAIVLAVWGIFPVLRRPCATVVVVRRHGFTRLGDPLFGGSTQDIENCPMTEPNLLKTVGFIAALVGTLGSAAVLFLPKCLTKWEKCVRTTFIVIALLGIISNRIGDQIIAIANAPRAISPTERNRISARMQAFAGDDWIRRCGWVGFVERDFVVTGVSALERLVLCLKAH
jgi:hypothetical protein